MNIPLPNFAQYVPFDAAVEVAAQPSMADVAAFNGVVNLAYKLGSLLLLYMGLKVVNRLNSGTWNSFGKIKEDSVALSINRAAWVLAGGLVLAFG